MRKKDSKSHKLVEHVTIAMKISKATDHILELTQHNVYLNNSLSSFLLIF